MTDVTDESNAALRAQNEELRKVLEQLTLEAEKQQQQLKSLQQDADKEIENLKLKAVTDLVTSHDKTVKEQQKKFEERLNKLDEDIKKKKEAVSQEDTTQREKQLAEKDEIEKDYRAKLDKIRGNLDEKETAIQKEFEDHAKNYTAKMEKLSEDISKLQKAECNLFSKIEELSKKEETIDLVAQRKELESQMETVRKDCIERIKYFEDQTAEMLIKKQQFFDERAAYLMSQESERKEEEDDYLLLVKDALVEQQKLYEDDLKNQGIMLQSMLQRDERTREEVEKQNAKSQYRANMKSEIAGMAEQIEKLKKELPEK